MTNPNRWLKSQIETVGAQAASIPDTPVLHFQSAKAVPVAIREMLTEVDAQMAALEGSTEFTPDAIVTRRKAIARDAITALQARSKIAAAKDAADRRKAALAAKAPKPEPKSAAEIQIASEVRAHVAKATSPLLEANRLMQRDKTVAAAILEGPAFLSGLTDEQVATLKAAHVEKDESPEGKEISAIDAALKVLDGTLASATSMIASRAGLKRTTDGASWQ